MPIAVVCPGCKSRFNVSDKFAGKKGPCPKCKTTLTIPAAAAEEVKIHEPEQYASGGKNSKGILVGKPIPRSETKIPPVLIAAIACTVLLALVVCLVGRSLAHKVPLVVVGLTLLSPPLAVAGYSFLREDELEPHQGRALWIRASLCGLVYAILWGVYWKIWPALPGDLYQWLFIAPPLIGIGGLAALACFDLDFTSGALHYSFYLLMTLILAFVMGLQPLGKFEPTAQPVGAQQTAADGLPPAAPLQ